MLQNLPMSKAKQVVGSQNTEKVTKSFKLDLKIRHHSSEKESIQNLYSDHHAGYAILVNRLVNRSRRLPTAPLSFANIFSRDLT